MSYTARAVTNENGNRRTVLDSVNCDDLYAGNPRFDVDWTLKRKEKIGNLKGTHAWDLLVDFIMTDNPAVTMRDIATVYGYKSQKRLDVCGRSYFSKGSIIGKVQTPEKLGLQIGCSVVK